MNKKRLSLLLALVMVLGSFSTVLAADFDITHNTDPSKNTDVLEFMDDLDIFGEVADNMTDYKIELDGEKYSVEDVNEKTDKGLDLREAIEEIKGGDSEGLKVVEVSAINATDLKVTLSDGSVHDVTLDEELEQNVATDVEFTIDGEDYEATVTWVFTVEGVKEELKEAKADHKAKKAAYEKAEKTELKARQKFQYEKKYGTEEDIKTARRALEDAEEAKEEAQEARNEAYRKIEALELKLARAETYETAEKAVIKAEKSNKQADLTAARTLVKNLGTKTYGDLKTGLEDRLAEVSKVILAEEKVEEAEKNIKDGYPDTAQDSHDKAVKQVKALEDGETKTDLENRLAKVQTDIDEALEDREEAEKVDKLINDLPKVADLKLEDKEDVEEARKAYDSLSKDQKEEVKHEDWLKAKEDKISELEVREVEVMIYELPDVTDQEDKNDFTGNDLIDISKARDVYEELTDAQQEKVARAYVKKLEDLEEIIAK